MKPAHYRTVYVSMCLALLAVACAPKPGESAAEPPTASAEQLAGVPEDDTCNAARYAHLIGRPIDMPGMVEASADLRHIYPDSQVTMDFRPDRVNFRINENDRITEITCG